MVICESNSIVPKKTILKAFLAEQDISECVFEEMFQRVENKMMILTDSMHAGVSIRLDDGMDDVSVEPLQSR